MRNSLLPKIVSGTALLSSLPSHPHDIAWTPKAWAAAKARYASVAAGNAPSVVAEKEGGLAKILLNRPKALNALDLDMCRRLQECCDAWQKDPAVGIILMQGEGKGFCAGGDVVGIRAAHVNDPDQDRHGKGLQGQGVITADFFREEYQMDYSLATTSKTQVSIWDGVVMGGGVGVSVHGNFRVATEKSLFAMPETGIGLVPDVGGSHFLPRLDGGLGAYIGLTGVRLKAPDLVYSGIATHYIGDSKLGAVEAELKSLLSANPAATAADVGALLDDLAAGDPVDLGKARLPADREAIDRCFANKQSVDDILKSLQEEDSEWASKTLKTLMRASPTAVKVTHKMLTNGSNLDLDDCFKMEYRISQRFMRKNSDFYEGIRALLVDKDNNASWSPSSLDQVTDAIVDEFFYSLAENELKIEKY